MGKNHKGHKELKEAHSETLFVALVFFVVGPMDSYLVAYDICNPKRLRKVARTCEDFGFRRLYSVFLCRLSVRDLVKLKSRLYDDIDLLADPVRFIPLCGRDRGLRPAGGEV
jgi:CRISPR-associated protein Cas2